MNTDYQSPPLRVASRIANHARAGMLHAAAAVFHPAGRFTQSQVDALRRDPELIVDEATADGKVPFDPSRTEEQLAAHLAHDPASLSYLISRLLPGVIMPWHEAPTETVVTQFGAGGTAGSASVGVETLPANAVAAMQTGAMGLGPPLTNSDPKGLTAAPAAAGAALPLEPSLVDGPASAAARSDAALAGAGAADVASGAGQQAASADAPPAPPAADPPARASRGKAAQEAAS